MDEGLVTSWSWFCVSYLIPAFFFWPILLIF